MTTQPAATPAPTYPRVARVLMHPAVLAASLAR